MPQPTRNPPALGHIGITVPSLDPAVAWYRDVLGLDVFVNPFDVEADGSHGGEMAATVFGAGFGRFRQAQLSTANGVALELFEFLDPCTRPAPEHFAYWQVGWFHLCLVERDVEGLARRIDESGGRQRTPVLEIRPGEPYQMCYCEDPFGLIIEIYSHSHEQTCGAMPERLNEVAA
jgi:catechol 2,3-dioxygenase-like lactoylglutathione lyase family enzyme